MEHIGLVSRVVKELGHCPIIALTCKCESILCVAYAVESLAALYMFAFFLLLLQVHFRSAVLDRPSD